MAIVNVERPKQAEIGREIILIGIVQSVRFGFLNVEGEPLIINCRDRSIPGYRWTSEISGSFVSPVTRKKVRSIGLSMSTICWFIIPTSWPQYKLSARLNSCGLWRNKSKLGMNSRQLILWICRLCRCNDRLDSSHLLVTFKDALAVMNALPRRRWNICAEGTS